MTEKDDKPSNTLKLSANKMSLGGVSAAPSGTGGAQVEVRKLRTPAKPLSGLRSPGVKASGVKAPGGQNPAALPKLTGKLGLKLGGDAATGSQSGGQKAGSSKVAPPKIGGTKIEIKRTREAAPASSEPLSRSGGDSVLTSLERKSRKRALELAQQAEAERAAQEAKDAKLRAEREELDRQRAEEDLRKANEAESRAHANEQEHERKAREEEELRRRVEEEARKKLEAEDRERREKQSKAANEKAKGRVRQAPPKPVESKDEASDFLAGGRIKRAKAHVPTQRDTAKKNQNERRRSSKLSVTKALAEDEDRMRSLASIRRRREKEKMDAKASRQQGSKIVRDVTVPDTITVQELANRMAVRGTDVVKSLMKMGMMVTINQTIDADTAELVVEEFGHRLTRISAEDVEIGLRSTPDDQETDLLPRPPVVTVMGHVDHGKTSLLDALRSTSVASGEAGGITQHIGAYQVELKSGDRMTFLDTPGHAAFSEMRARGANATDIVVLVVAADDSIMPQTVEAIAHTKAAGVPMIVAVNKCDKPDANPKKVETDLLQHEIVAESMGGDTIVVPVSALTGEGLDVLQENILLTAEMLELKANPDRAGEGVVVEAKIEKGRGSVATILVNRGTLKVGDLFVVGEHWGKVRALLNDQGKKIMQAIPSQPVGVLGLNGTPRAGEEFVVVENEARAREVSEYRANLAQEKRQAATGGGTLEQMFSQIKSGVAKQLAIVVKADVQGSVEAIEGALAKYTNNEVTTRVILGQAGPITESDITLANASGAMVVGFNVRANPQAKDMAKRDGVDIRYFSIIYELLDDVKALLSGMLKPEMRENFLGYAEIREVFHVTKIGKVAGCYMTDGVVKRNCGVRLLRDNTVIHEGKLKTLKRFKDEVPEVRNGMECGMAFENFENIQAGDQIECFEVEAIARNLDDALAATARAQKEADKAAKAAAATAATAEEA